MKRSAAAVESAAAFMRVLRSTPFATAQTRLLNTKDRDLAAILALLGEEERAEVYSRVGPAKTEKLRSEIERMQHVRLDADTVARIASHLVEHLSGDRPLGPASRYFRPHRDDR
jgi:flagellar motor switch protein FliG